MEDKNKKTKKPIGIKKSVLPVLWLVLGIIAIMAIYRLARPALSVFKTEAPEESVIAIQDEDDFDKIENGIHLRTGFIAAPGLMETVNNCTNCHSSKLVTQNRMDKERWAATIRWMQETQNLWDLGKNEDIIINYLVSNYPPKELGRRENLGEIEWYVLEE